jgi:hypothetical protein
MIKRLGYWRGELTDPKKGIAPNIAANLDKALWKPYTDYEQYPWPGDLTDAEFWAKHDKARVIGYLQAGIACNHYRGYSGCRLCGEHLGSHERTDGIWCWPDRLDHYVLAHNVRLPEEFIAEMVDISTFETNMEQKDIKPHAIQDGHKFYHFEVNDEFWIKWGQASHG